MFETPVRFTANNSLGGRSNRQSSGCKCFLVKEFNDFFHTSHCYDCLVFQCRVPWLVDLWVWERIRRIELDNSIVSFFRNIRTFIRHFSRIWMNCDDIQGLLTYRAEKKEKKKRNKIQGRSLLRGLKNFKITLRKISERKKKIKKGCEKCHPS